MSTVAIETLGARLVLPFGFIYLHELRGFPTQSGSLLAANGITTAAAELSRA